MPTIFRDMKHPIFLPLKKRLFEAITYAAF